MNLELLSQREGKFLEDINSGEQTWLVPSALIPGHTQKQHNLLCAHAPSFPVNSEEPTRVARGPRSPVCTRPESESQTHVVSPQAQRHTVGDITSKRDLQAAVAAGRPLPAPLHLQHPPSDKLRTRSKSVIK